MPPVMPEHPPEFWSGETGSATSQPAADGASPDESGGARRFAGRTLVIGFVLAAALLAVTAVWAFGKSGTKEGPYRTLEAAEYDGDVLDCRVQPDGRPTATGTIRNRTGATQILVVEVALVDPEGIVIDTPRATLVDVTADAETEWQVASPYEIPRLTPLTCRIQDVFATPTR